MIDSYKIEIFVLAASAIGLKKTLNLLEEVSYHELRRYGLAVADYLYESTGLPVELHMKRQDFLKLNKRGFEFINQDRIKPGFLTTEELGDVTRLMCDDQVLTALLHINTTKELDVEPELITSLVRTR